MKCFSKHEEICPFNIINHSKVTLETFKKLVYSTRTCPKCETHQPKLRKHIISCLNDKIDFSKYFNKLRESNKSNINTTQPIEVYDTLHELPFFQFSEELIPSNF